MAFWLLYLCSCVIGQGLALFVLWEARLNYMIEQAVKV